MESQKRLIGYKEIAQLFDKQYKETMQLIHSGEKHLDNLAEGFTEAEGIIWKLFMVDGVTIDQGYAKIAQKLWTYICTIYETHGAYKATYEEMAYDIRLTNNELALCRKLENADAR